jgi:hypothetical protein
MPNQCVKSRLSVSTRCGLMYDESMKKDHYLLRELSKFFAGIIAADIIVGLWTLMHHVYAFPFLGMMFSPPPVYTWITVDFLLFVFLIHYGWKLSLPLKHPQKVFFVMAGTVFLIVAGLHLLRIMFGISLSIGGVAIPYWLNVLGVIVTTFLGYVSLSFAFQKRM